MLEKLIKLEITNKYIDSIEYWLSELEDTRLYSLAPLISSLKTEDDAYVGYVQALNSTGNIHLQAINLLLNSGDIISAFFSNSSNRVAQEFVTRSPYALIELFKICTRLFFFNSSLECSEIRNMTLTDADYDYALNTRVMLSTIHESSTGLMSDSELHKFWSHINALTVSRGPTHDSICGSWKARDQEDVLSRHFLRQFKQVIPDQSVNGTLREWCRTCGSLCDHDSTVYSDWFVELYSSDAHPLVEVVYSYCILLSVAFLLATLFVFCGLPFLRRPVHGKCTLFHLLSMTAAYTSLTLPQLIKDLNLKSATLCYVNGHLMQFGFLAMFFWLNVMCFDIMLAFCYLRNRKKALRSEQKEINKLIWYCCYGWGGPTLILAITLLLEYSPIMDPEDYFKPDIGGPKCFFLNVETQWIFLYGPIGCLILANLIMFAITALTIYRHSRSSDVLQLSDNSATTQNDNNRLKVYINLFILMGANWAMEALSWALPHKQWFSYLTDITTTLQGVFVFILFVCKPRIIKELRVKFGCPPKTRNTIANRNKTNASLSSNKSSGLTQTQSLDEI